MSLNDICSGLPACSPGDTHATLTSLVFTRHASQTNNQQPFWLRLTVDSVGTNVLRGIQIWLSVQMRAFPAEFAGLRFRTCVTHGQASMHMHANGQMSKLLFK